MLMQLGELGFDRRAVRVERGAQLLLRTLDVPQRVIAVGDGVAQIGQAMRDAVELPLCLADHLSRLIQLRRGGRGFARARDGVQLRLVALLELAILIEPAAHLALTALLRVHRLTSPIERRRGAFLLFDDCVKPRH